MTICSRICGTGKPTGHFSSGVASCFCVSFSRTASCGQPCKRRNTLVPRQWLRHERMTVALALSEALHHTTSNPALPTAPRRRKTERAASFVEVVETITQECFSNPMEVFEEVVESVDVATPQVVEEVVDVAQISPERIRENIAIEVPQERDQEPLRGADSGYPFAFLRSAHKHESRSRLWSTPCHKSQRKSKK